MTGMGDGQGAEFYAAVAWQQCGSHFLFHVLTCLVLRRGNLSIQVPKVLPRLSLFPQKHLTFNQPAIPVYGADLTHFIVGQWFADNALEIA